MRSDYLNNNSSASSVGLNAKFEEISAARTLDSADSGKVFGVNQASAYEITLPKVSEVDQGWNAKFILTVVAANAVTIANNTDEDTIVGYTSGGDGGSGSSTDSTAVDEIVFISGAQLGDCVELFCDGSYFHAKATAHDVAHITIS
jgi:hypothetical protein|tara:strand:- start:888 stop:1325 length:438 start_codon:yes stop_codon:yes gene_type:complete